MSSLHLNLPGPLSALPRAPLLLTPSPIHPLPRISAALSSSSLGSGTAPVSVYTKREDLTSGLAFGGNKTRKLEYLLADALAKNCTTLVSIGGLQSNHTRQVAAVAARHGLKAVLVQENWVDWQDPGYETVGNIQLSRLMGADVRIVNEGFGIGHKSSLKEVVRQCEEAGEKPYYIPAGASDHPLGGLGFARWVFELREQEREMGLFFDTIVVCAVTGSTMAGMLAGVKLCEKLFPDEKKRRLLGIDASAKPKETKEQVLRIAKNTAALIGLKEEDITDKDIELDERYHAGTYGVPDKGTWAAMEYAARMEALITDPVYEGKSMAGMLDMIQKGEIQGNVLFAHLGGQMALNAYSQLGHTK